VAETVALVLAAGQGKRMRSRLPKVLHPIGGRPMLAHVLAAARGAGIGRLGVVVGYEGERVRAALAAAGVAAGVEFILQPEQRGTGDAVMAARPWVPAGGTLLVLCGDTPLLTPDLLRDLLDRHARRRFAATLLSARLADPDGYGRILRGPDGRVRAIVEQADCTPEEARVNEVNTGIGCYGSDELFAALERVTPDNAQGEFYLTDAVGVLCGEGRPVEALPVDDVRLVFGVNDRAGLAAAERALRERTLERLLAQGVTVVDPATTFVDDRAEIGPDTVLLPLTFIEGPCLIGEGCRLGPGAHLRDSRLGASVAVWHSVVESSELGDGVEVGPYSHLRPGTRLAAGARVGNFAELKNAAVGPGSKVPHHSYLGDVDLGADVNVGAGTVTVNFDGADKHPTRVGDRAFLGCNTNLIAPVEVGEGAYVAAGSTVTEDVPPGALAIARARQVVKPGWVSRRFGARRAGRSPEGEERERRDR
jgi:bifunctional UDP-N-acetylglucosamine pyrophosphorylase/glucosamine-1-phosphate N-acetyltransferase